MSVDPRLLALTRTAEFWADYYGDDVFGDLVADPPGEFLDFPLGPRYRLRVSVLDDLGGKFFAAAGSLRLMASGDERGRLLGWWRDDGHVHPHVLRWDEADLLSRLASHEWGLPHPGIAFLLLCPYVAPLEEPARWEGLRRFDEALRATGAFNEPQIRRRLLGAARLYRGAEWRHGPLGWACQLIKDRRGFGFHSLRQLPDGDAGTSSFPSQEWADAIADAERLAPAARPANSFLTPGELEQLPPIRRFYYQVIDSDQAYSTLTPIRRGLFDAGLGSMELSGSWSAFADEQNPEADWLPGDEYAVTLCGEVDELVAVIRRAAGGPDVRLYEVMPRAERPPYRRIPLDAMGSGQPAVGPGQH